MVCFSAVAQSSAPASQPTSPKAPPTGGLAPGAPPLQLRSLPPEEHTLTPAEKAQVQRAQAYRAAVHIAALTARWGPEMSTPGVSATLVQVSRTKTPAGATEFTYQIAGTGFRSGEKLDLVRWPLGGGIQSIMSGLVLNSQGIAVCGTSATAKPGATAAPAAGLSSAPAPQAGTSTPPADQAPSCSQTLRLNQPVQFQTAAAPGEAVRAALIGEDHSNGAATQAIPFPIADTEKGCYLQVLLGMKDADMVVLEGNGLPSNAIVKIDKLSGNQTQILKSRTDPAGHMAMLVLPSVPGQTSGTTTLRYVGVDTPAAPTPQAGKAPAANGASQSSPAPATPACSPAVSFHWGPGSYKPE